jgi:hydroxymethylpyrimidine/phosphomethylpyrimidine kinase
VNIALTIAGSDSGGGAGIQADLKTFHQFGVFGTSVITAITAQNTTGVRKWTALSPDIVTAQLDAVIEDLHPRSCKSGMIPNAKVARAIADGLKRYQIRNYVLDPVMVATSGDSLLEADTVSVIRETLIPLAALITPNSLEAEAILKIPLRSEAELGEAARRLVQDFGARAALVTGGHLETGDSVADVLFDGEIHVFRNARIMGREFHGTGCTLSAAITAELASGKSLRESVQSGIEFVHRAIATAPDLGSGASPLNHFVSATIPTNSRTSN